MLGIIIREGEPDSVTLWFDQPAGSCSELLESIPEDEPTDFVDVEGDGDIKTG